MPASVIIIIKVLPYLYCLTFGISVPLSVSCCKVSVSDISVFSLWLAADCETADSLELLCWAVLILLGNLPQCSET